MKVFLPSLDKHPSTGKGFFYNRLALELAHVVDVCGENISYDVALNNTRVRDVRAKYQIVRINGVYHDTGRNYKQLNRQVFKGFHNRPDGVIYQSKFSKKMADKYIGATKKPTKVIYNGADPEYYRYIESAEKWHQFNFFAFSRWRPHKRLKEIVESFLLADINDSCLYVAGDLSMDGGDKQWRKSHLFNDKVRYLGILTQQEIAKYLKMMNAIIHLCWFDSCPNSVVEAIVAGIPVISNNVGGTAEIVKLANGYVCDIDRHTLKPVNLYHPPAIDKTKIVDALNKSITEKIVINKEPFLIKNVAQQYCDFFREVIRQ